MKTPLHIAALLTALALGSTDLVAGPRTLVFNSASPEDAPEVLLPATPAAAVPKTSLLHISIGIEEKGHPGVLVLEEQNMILDQGKTATPGADTKPKKRRSKKSKR